MHENLKSTKMKSHILTIGIATYNRSVDCKKLLIQFLPLLKKWGNKVELIVCNDGGANGDNIQAFVNMMSRYGCCIRMINRQVNKQIFETRYELLTNADSDWFMFIDDDDYVNVLTLNDWLEYVNSLEEGHRLHVSGRYGDDVDLVSFNLVEFHHDNSSKKAEIHDRREYYKSKTKLPVSLNANILHLSKLEVNLPLLREAIDKIERHSQNIGEDVFCLYHLVGRKKDINVRIADGTLSYINYDMSNEHMAWIDRDVNYVPGVNGMRIYTNEYHKTLK